MAIGKRSNPLSPHHEGFRGSFSVVKQHKPSFMGRNDDSGKSSAEAKAIAIGVQNAYGWVQFPLVPPYPTSLIGRATDS